MFLLCVFWGCRIKKARLNQVMQFKVIRIKDVVGTRHRGSVFQVGEILQRSSPGMPFKLCFRVHQWRGVENARVETFGPQDDRVKYKPTDKNSSHQNEATGP